MKSFVLRFSLFAFAVVLMAACGPNRDKELQAIEEQEEMLSSINVAYDDSNASEMLALYRKFVADFPNDSLAPVYMLRAADLCINIGRPEEAIDLLDSIIDMHPDFSDVAGCCFLKGFAYENAGLYDEAREAYSYFVETYPDHYLAEDVRKTIPYVGMTPEEMFDAIMNAANDEGIRS